MNPSPGRESEVGPNQTRNKKLELPSKQVAVGAVLLLRCHSTENGPAVRSREVGVSVVSGSLDLNRIDLDLGFEPLSQDFYLHFRLPPSIHFLQNPTLQFTPIEPHEYLVGVIRPRARPNSNAIGCMGMFHCTLIPPLKRHYTVVAGRICTRDAF